MNLCRLEEAPSHIHLAQVLAVVHVKNSCVSSIFHIELHLLFPVVQCRRNKINKMIHDNCSTYKV